MYQTLYIEKSFASKFIEKAVIIWSLPKHRIIPVVLCLYWIYFMVRIFLTVETFKTLNWVIVYLHICGCVVTFLLCAVML